MAEIKLVWFEMTQKEVMDGLDAESFPDTKDRLAELKWKALEKIGITPKQFGDTPLKAWIRHLSEINGLEYTTPCHPDIASAIQWNVGCQRFLWFLS